MYLVINPDTNRVFQDDDGQNYVFDTVDDAHDWCDEHNEIDCPIVKLVCFS